MGCCGEHCAATVRHFDGAVAARDLERYRRAGPDLTTRILLGVLRGKAGRGSTLLDVGGGVGALSLELLDCGFEGATLVDASPEYLVAAGREAKRRGLHARLKLVLGDVVAVTEDLGLADVVALDRVVCCYPDYVALLEKALAHCRSVLALSYPRDRWYVRAIIWFENLARRVRGDRFRAFVHPEAGIEAIVRRAGFRCIGRRGNWVWRVDVYDLAAAA